MGGRRSAARPRPARAAGRPPKQKAKLEEWEKELAPSTELREWFGHEPSRFAEFRRRYIGELRHARPRLTELRRRARGGTLTLVYSAHDSEHNDAVVLAEVLAEEASETR